MNLILATHNPHKATEIKVILEPLGFNVRTLNDFGFIDEIEETGDTLEENAKIKALSIASQVDEFVLADDSGLEVEALNGAPGVYSARFAGEPSDANKNIDLLLKKLLDKENRAARFRTVLVLAKGSQVVGQFEGIINGTITTLKFGQDGFGYDPVFKPINYHLTFAEMSAGEKNKISHRARALESFKLWIENNPL